MPVGENVKAEGQTQRPSNPFCVPDDFQTGFIFLGVTNDNNTLYLCLFLLFYFRLYNRLFIKGGEDMKIVCYAEPTDNGLLLHYPSVSVKAELLHLWEGAKENYNGYLAVDLKKPYKSRSTGKGSQNNLFYALVTEICKETGNDLEDIKDYLKEKACARRSYPYEVNKMTGRIRPYSTTKVDTVQMAGLIEEAYQLCAELGIIVEN